MRCKKSPWRSGEGEGGEQHSGITSDGEVRSPFLGSDIKDM